MTNVVKAFENAFKYSFSTNKILPFFIINILIFGIGLALIDNIIGFLPILIGSSTNIGHIASVISTGILFALIFIVTQIVKIFFIGTIIDNVKQFPKNAPLSKSYGIVKKRYVNLIVALALVAIIGFVVGWVPFIGWTLSIIFSWFFLLVAQSVIISKSDAMSSLKNSYNIFMKNKLDVFIFWLLIAIIGTIFFGIALIPLFVAVMPIIGTIISSIAANDFTSIISLVRTNMLAISIGGVFTSIILAYIEVFQESAKTFFFISVKKR